jgi:membrane fusion protein (multidrug efflux system)
MQIPYRHFLLISCFTLLLYGCHEAQKPTLEPVPVTTVIVQPTNVPAVLEYVGVANSSHLVEIRARVEGYLQKIAYKEGEMVHEGDLLFQIDPKPFEAVLAQAKAVEEQQKAVLWQAQRALERFTPLYEQKAASKRDLDNATAQVMGAQASVDGSLRRHLFRWS